jgi:pimeloyl-ACP methyl ester carboxylesterase
MPEPSVLLVHGSCHGAWCWRDVLPELERLGIYARAIDLPGHGADTTPLSEVTLDSYAQAILDALEGFSPGPAVLVGHSMAGYPITAAACLRPDRIAALVYLCAYRPKDGMSLVDMRKAWPEQPLVPVIRPHADGPSFTFDDAALERLFYHDCPPATVAYARANLTPQPIAPQATPLHLTAEVAALPQHYIVCTEDRVIPPDYQRQMAAGVAGGALQSLTSSHSPFFSQPAALAACIARAVRG